MGLNGSLGIYIFSRMGSVGMCLFFLSSSYLITILLLKEKGKTGSVNVPKFFSRRMLRIWPLYFFALAWGFIESRLEPGQSFSRHHLAAYLLFFGNWYSIAAGPIRSPWAPLWSINVEEQFYLSWPFLVKGGRRMIWAVSILSMIVGFATLTYLASIGHRADDLNVWYNSFVQFIFFGLGSILALTVGSETRPLGLYARSALATAGLAAAFLYSWISIVPPQSVSGVCASYIFGGVASLAFFFAVAGLNPQLIHPWFVRLGKISFGLYVFHGPLLSCVYLHLRNRLPRVLNPIAEMVVPAFALLLTVLCAEASYRVLEEPFLLVKKRFEMVHSRPV